MDDFLFVYLLCRRRTIPVGRRYPCMCLQVVLFVICCGFYGDLVGSIDFFLNFVYFCLLQFVQGFMSFFSCLFHLRHPCPVTFTCPPIYLCIYLLVLYPPDMGGNIAYHIYRIVSTSFCLVLGHLHSCYEEVRRRIYRSTSL